MEMEETENSKIDDLIEKSRKESQIEKEKKLIKLLTEIIVSATLKEYYEESD